MLNKNLAKFKFSSQTLRDRVGFDSRSLGRCNLTRLLTISKSLWPIANEVQICKSKSNFKLIDQNRIPLKLIPNCSKLICEIADYDWALKLFGIKSRFSNGITYMLSGNNNNANRILIGIFLTMKQAQLRGDMTEFWRLGWRLMNSSIYLVSALNHVIPGWERKYSQKDIIKILREVFKLTSERAYKIDFKRVYIPKANGKSRPLGVPRKAWRIYLHMLNNLIVWSVIGKEQNQHGYLPQKGVTTAWRAILSKIKRKNIYEFDLKGFFDNVKLEGNKKLLIEELGYPEEIANHIKKLNQSLVKLCEVDLIDEPDRKVLLDSDGNINKQNNLKEEVDISKLSTKEVKGYMKQAGVPQGAATSCGLSTINLSHMWKLWSDELIMYADDGLILSDESINPEKINNEENGIIHSIEKSGWVKKDGIWLKPLKFLGLVYTPKELNEIEELSSNTRSGVRVKVTTEMKLAFKLLAKRSALLETKDKIRELIIAEKLKLDEWIRSNVTEESTLSEIMESKWSGKLLSYLYNGIWSRNLGKPKLKVIPKSYMWYRWGQIQLEFITNNLVSILDMLEKYYSEELTRIETNGTSKWVLEEGKLVRQPKLKRVDYLEKKSKELGEVKKVIKGMSRVDLKINLMRFFKVVKDCESEVKSPTSENTEELNKSLKWILKETKLEIYNSSSHASSDLLSLLDQLNLSESVKAIDQRLREERYIAFPRLYFHNRKANQASNKQSVTVKK